MRPRSRVALPALLVVLALAPPAAAGRATGAALARPDSGARLPALGFRVEAVARDTALIVPPLPEPRVSYGSFRAAGERLTQVVRQALGACADSGHWARETTEFRYRDHLSVLQDLEGHPFWALEARDTLSHVPGLHLTLETRSARCPGEEALVAALTNAGWVEDFQYEGDGPDGTTFGFFCREALCWVGLSWDGGDDSDSTYVPRPGSSLELVCVPRPPPDPRLRRASGPSR